jgi:FkbM family methyltransferase
MESEIAALPTLVPPGSIAIDIGANRGIYAYALSRIASHVHSFEPLKECCEYIDDHGSARITVHNVALSDATGEFDLFIPIDEGRKILTRASLEPDHGQHEQRRILVMKLDDFDFGPIAFIKIDVEGAEFSVLRGAASTLDTHRPNLLVEIDRTRHDESSFRTMLDWLMKRGYVPHVFVEGKLRESSEPWRAPEAIYNFIFLPNHATSRVEEATR